jgi:hypothetical protein
MSFIWKVILAASILHSTLARILFPWLCLERCGENSSAIAAELLQLSTNRSVFTAAAFEDFNLGPNSTLIANNLTQVSSALHEDGLSTYAMVSSFPYPPQFLDYMRQVFANPGPFIMQCLAAAQSQSLSGFNIDWEPQSGETPTPEDAIAYAQFLANFTAEMHIAGLVVSVDVATWSPIWNITAIAASGVDYVATMSTYTDDWPTWQRELAYFVKTVPPHQLVVGLETVHASDGLPYSTSELTERFQALAAEGVHQVAVWKSPIPDNWWPFLRAL